MKCLIIDLLRHKINELERGKDTIEPRQQSNNK